MPPLRIRLRRETTESMLSPREIGTSTEARQTGPGTGCTRREDTSMIIVLAVASGAPHPGQGTSRPDRSSGPVCAECGTARCARRRARRNNRCVPALREEGGRATRNVTGIPDRPLQREGFYLSSREGRAIENTVNCHIDNGSVSRQEWCSHVPCMRQSIAHPSIAPRPPVACCRNR